MTREERQQLRREIDKKKRIVVQQHDRAERSLERMWKQVAKEEK